MIPSVPEASFWRNRLGRFPHRMSSKETIVITYLIPTLSITHQSAPVDVISRISRFPIGQTALQTIQDNFTRPFTFITYFYVSILVGLSISVFFAV